MYRSSGPLGEALPPTAGRATKVARVADRIRTMVHDGRLGEGDPLPSTRRLAAELGLSRGTVTAAYEQLDGEGYLVLRHGTVPRVAATMTGFDGGAPGGRSSPAGPSGGSLTPVVGTPLPEPTPPTRPRTRRTGDLPGTPAVVDLQPGVPCVTAISVRDRRAAWRHALAVPLEARYPDPAGEPALRTQVATQLALSRGVASAADQVIVTAGTSEAISLITEALPASAPRMAVENPGYRAGRQAITSAGGAVVPVPVTPRGMDVDALRAAHAARPLDAVLVTPSHQYPLGGAMPVAHRQALLDWAAAEGVWVVEDDYDSEFRHRGAPLPALAALDSHGVVVHLGSFSKVLDPQLRCGYLMLPAGDASAGSAPDGGAPVAEAVRAARSGRGAAVASVVQHALAHLMSTGALRRHVARCRRDYRVKRELVAEAFADLPGVRVRALDGGLHAVLELERPAAGLVADLAARGVHVSDLQDYAVDGSGLALRGIVLGYAPPSATVLRDALRTIRTVLLDDQIGSSWSDRQFELPI